MLLSDYLKKDLIFISNTINSKKLALEFLSNKVASMFDTDSSKLLALLLERERLGSTGVGHHIAIPHARIDGFEESVIAFLKLENPIDFDAVDDEGVDIIIALFVSNENNTHHLKLLSTISRYFRDLDFCNEIRSLDNEEEIFAKINQYDKKVSKDNEA